MRFGLYIFFFRYARACVCVCVCVCGCGRLCFSVGLAYSALISLIVTISHRYVKFRHENSVFIKIIAFRRKKCCYNDFRFEVSRNTIWYKNEPNYVKFCLEILILIEIVNFVTKSDIMENCPLKMIQETLSNTKRPVTTNYKRRIDCGKSRSLRTWKLRMMISHRYVEFQHENSVFNKIEDFRRKNRCYSDFGYWFWLDLQSFDTKTVNTENCSSKMTQEILSNTKTPSYSKLWNEKLISVSHAAFAQEIWRRILLWYHWE